jgi:MFS family permease
MSIIALPWTPKLFYGIFTDTFPILGSSKRSYLILMGFIQTVANLAVVLTPVISIPHLVICCMMSQLSCAVMDVIVDGLMVMQAKAHPIGGSEDLQSYSWVMFGLGGVVGSLVGGAITLSFDPCYSFYFVAFVGMIISTLGLCMDSSLESGNANIINMGFAQRSSKVFAELCKGL